MQLQYESTDPLVFYRFSSLAHKLLHAFNIHLFVYLGENFVSLLETMHHRDLDEREFNIRYLRCISNHQKVKTQSYELLQLFQLAVSLLK